MQFLDKWHRSRLTSQDFICSIFQDSINHQKQREEAKYKGVDLWDVIGRIFQILAVSKKGRGFDPVLCWTFFLPSITDLQLLRQTKTGS